MKRLSVAIAALALSISAAHAATYEIDANHSSVMFNVRHVVGKVAGHFGKFSGSFNYDGKALSGLTAQAAVDVASIDTGIEKRDNHLRSPDFFDAQKYPSITFKSTKVSD